MKKMYKSLVFITLCLFCQIAYSQTPIPTKPQPLQFINDYANLLKETEQKALEKRLTIYHDSTGIPLVVVTIPSIGYANPTDFSASLFREWGIGHPDKNNGILIFINADSTARYAHITTGAGLATVLPDSLCKSISDVHLVPLLKQGRYYNAILHTAHQLSNFASPHFTIPKVIMPPKKEPKPLTFKEKLAVAFMILLSIIMLYFRIMNPSKYISKRRWRWGRSSFSGGRSFGGGSFDGGGSSGSW